MGCNRGAHLLASVVGDPQHRLGQPVFILQSELDVHAQGVANARTTVNLIKGIRHFEPEIKTHQKSLAFIRQYDTADIFF